MPPAAKYFGLTAYVFDRNVGARRKMLYASLGDTLNQESIDLPKAPEDAFGSETVVIAPADRRIERLVRDAFVDAGMEPGRVKTLPVPSALARLGVDQQADRVGIMMRYAVAECCALREGDVGPSPHELVPSRVLHVSLR